jgi:deoxycytidylate deaminase
MKFIKKSIQLSYQLFPSQYSQEKGRRPYHFAFIFKKGLLVSFGVNSYQQCPKILKLGRRFNIRKYAEYQYPHAETDAISKAWGKIHLDNSCAMTIIRLNRHGKLQDSKPCLDCQAILDSLGINKVWWSTKYGKITDGKKQLLVEDLGEIHGKK